MACGATVDVAQTTGGEVVPIEVHTDASSEADRYRIIAFTPLTVELVLKGAAGDFFPDHRYDCPATRATHVNRG